MAALLIADHALPNPHTGLDDVHYRLYLDSNGEPCVICVQSFDYFDYDAARLLTQDAHLDETAANIALNDLLTARLEAEDFAPGISRRLRDAGAPLTRQQALDAALS